MGQMALIVTNPATEETIAEIESAGVEEADAAVARAAAAFKGWRAVAPADRAQLLRRLATLVEENGEELARIESQNVGKPIAGARAEVGMVAQVFHFYAGAVDKHYGQTIPVAGGVVGQRLVEHPDVAKIGFTGSTEIGRGVMQGAAGTIKRVTLELGGKSANVVFADADLEKAAAAAPYAVFDNAGQDCCARSRILVERSAYDRFVELLVESTRRLTVGDPNDESTEMGPLISASHRETVASFVDGDTLFRGEAPAGSGF